MEDNKSKDEDFDFVIEEDEQEKKDGKELESQSGDKESESKKDLQEDINQANIIDNEDNTEDDDEDDFEIIEPNEEVNVQIDKDRKKRRIRLILTSIVVLILCSVGCYVFITQRAQLDKFGSALHDNQYALAKNIYSELMDSQRTEADLIVEEKVDEIYSRYYKGAINIDKAKEELNMLTNIGSGATEKLNEMKSLFAVLVKSEANYDKGKECYSLGELKNSIIYYGKVIPKDSHYRSAQNALKKISAEYRKAQIDIAEEYVADENYDAAIKVMYSYLKLLSKDKVALKQLQIYKSAKLDLNISDIQDSVDVCIKKSDYVGAIKIVKQAIDDYDEDKRLVSLLESLKESMYKEVNSYIESDRYAIAVSILKKYIKIDKDDNKATELIEKYSNKVSSGVFLSKVKPKSKEGKSYVIEELQDYKDANGEKYEDVLEVVGYRNLESKGNRVIENNGYTRLTGTIGYVSSKDIDYYKEGEGRIIISGDGKTLFTSEVMTEKSENQKVDLDIASYKTIKIAWEPIDEKNVRMYSIVLGDFKFTR